MDKESPKKPPSSIDEALPWDDMIIGERLGPVAYRIKPSTHKKHADLLNIHRPWFETEWNLFPWELGAWARAASKYYGHLKNTVQTGFKYEFFRTAKVGEPLFTTWMLLDKYDKVDKKYFSSCTDTTNEKGELVVRATTEGIDLRSRGKKLEPRSAAGRENWSGLGEFVPASPNLPEGLILLTRTKGPLPMRVSGFSTGGWAKDKWEGSVHEASYAAEMGFKAPIVEGPIVWEFGILELLLDFFGPEALFTTGVADVNIRGPGYVGDTLIGKARIREKVKESGGVRIVLETRIERIDGQLINVGTASAVVREEADSEL